MNKFTSFLSPLIKAYVFYQKASGHFNEASYEPNLLLFDRYLKKKYPKATSLSQEMVNGWCSRRDTETNNSCRSRIYVVKSLIQYLRKREKTDLKNNLYKIWNRMSSGSYFPPPVKAVQIPKKSGGSRMLGVPSVADRVAQMVAKIYFEPTVEPYFHRNSYGYRPGKSAVDALAVTRKRCWKYNWVLEFDIKALFDSIDHQLLMKAVRKHTSRNFIQY